jgi:hypothetical protein
VAELTRTGQNIAASTYRPLEIYATVGAIYLALNLLLAAGGGMMERRFGLTWTLPSLVRAVGSEVNDQNELESCTA